MSRRLALLVATALVAVLGLTASQATAAEMFGQQVTPGATISSVQATGAIRLTDVTVTSTSSGGVNASATLYAGASTTPVNVTVSYQDANNWTINVVRNGAGSGYAPSSATSLDINDVDGTITKAGGTVTYQLVLHGYVLGDGTFDMSVVVTPLGFEANTLVEDLELSGFTLESASITVSTLDSFAEVTGSLSSDAGSFDVDVLANAIPGGGYHLKMTADGADLAVSGGQFHMQSFHFSWESDAPATGCADFDVAVSGTAKIGNTTYTLNDAELAMSCSTVTKFIFSVTVAHTSKFDGLTKQATLTINWLTGPGTYTPTFGPKSEFTMPEISYYRGFFGTIDLSRTRSYSRGYDCCYSDFKRSVTIGIGFDVAAYTQQVVHFKVKKGVPKVSVTEGAPALSVGAMGYFDADRVSGDIACAFDTAPSTDFTCGGEMRINPEHAGVWHTTWGNL